MKSGPIPNTSTSISSRIVDWFMASELLLFLNPLANSNLIKSRSFINVFYIDFYLSFSLFIISTNILVFLGTTSVFSSAVVLTVFFQRLDKMRASTAPSTDVVIKQPSSRPNLPRCMPKILVLSLIVDNNFVLS